MRRCVNVFNHEWTRIHTNVVGRLCQTPANPRFGERTRLARVGRCVLATTDLD
jgi:hypothetical protein